MATGHNLTFVDFQNDFVAQKGALTFDEGKGDPNLISRVKSFFEQLPHGYFKNAIVTYDTHFPKTYAQSEEAKTFPPHCMDQTNGWELAIDKHLIESKIKTVQHLRKNTYDMWAETIDKISPDILAQTRDVVLFGVASDICNKAGIEGWLKKGIAVTVLEDLTRGIFKQTRDVLKEEPFKKAIKKGTLKIMRSENFLRYIQHERS